jgi:quinol monooxygenase YgiN
MHAVVVRVTIKDEDAAERELQEKVVPAVSQAPGFVAGYWTRKDNSGLSMVIFESEDAARQLADGMASTVPDTVTFESAEVRSVAAHA